MKKGPKGPFFWLYMEGNTGLRLEERSASNLCWQMVYVSDFLTSHVLPECQGKASLLISQQHVAIQERYVIGGYACSQQVIVRSGTLL